MYIAFFDSGIGGLTVLREALRILPNENYIYYADTDNTPYGTKTKNEVRDLTYNAAKFLAGQGIKALVIACNTATSAAVDDLRNEFPFPVIGMEPAVKPAIKKSMDAGKRVLVLATALTLKEEKFHNLVSRLDTDHIVDILPASKLVEFAENYIFEGSEVESYIKGNLLRDHIDDYGTIVFGCTHFVLFRQVFTRILPSGIELIDGNAGTVQHLYEILKTKDLLNQASAEGPIIYYKSGSQVKDKITRDLFEDIVKST